MGSVPVLGLDEKEMKMSITRAIVIGKKTQGHKETLESKGYECKVEGDLLLVTAKEAVLGTVDMSTLDLAREVLVDMVQGNKVFGYETRFITPQVLAGTDKACFGSNATEFLGPLASCLITKKVPGTKKTKGVGSLDSIFTTL